MANFTISTVLFRLSFCMMWFLCDSTVRTLMKKRSAISWLVVTFSPKFENFNLAGT